MSETKFPTGMRSGIWSGLSQQRSIPLLFCLSLSLFLLYNADRKTGNVLRGYKREEGIGDQGSTGLCIRSDPRKLVAL